MELRDYLRILRKRWVSITLITLLGLGGAVAASYLTTPTYQATTQVFVSVQGGTTTSDLLQGSSFSQTRVKSYVAMVDSPLVLQPVIDELGLEGTPQNLADRIDATNLLDTSLIDITVTDTNPNLAAAIADTVASNFSEVVADFERPEGGGASPVKLSTVRVASAPTQPASPRLTLNVALGLLVGLALGVGYAVLREVLDTRIREDSDIREVTSASILASVPLASEHTKDLPLVVHQAPQSIQAEAYRRLRTNLQFVDLEGGSRSIVVTSSIPGEGKSTTCSNLALALADAGSRVLLVDADLRRPSVAEYLGLEGAAGLTTVLIGRARLEDVAQPWGVGNLHVLTSGQIPPNPSELLGSDAMVRLLHQASASYDIVLLDTAPLLPVTDAAVLARAAGGALVVASAGQVHKQQLADALGALEVVDARVLGVVLNRAKRPERDGYSYHYYGSDGLTADGQSSASSSGRRSAPSDSRRHARAATRA